MLEQSEISLGFAIIMTGTLTKSLPGILDTAETMALSRVFYLNLGVSLVGETPRFQSHTFYLSLKPPILELCVSIAEPSLDSLLYPGLLV